MSDIEISNFNATSWGCWKCGRGFESDIPYAADIKPQNWTPESELYLCFVPICTECATGSRSHEAQAFYQRIEELETIMFRLPLISVVIRPYIRTRIAELRVMLERISPRFQPKRGSL